MTVNQLVAKIRDTLAAAVWPGGEKVFASVHPALRGIDAALTNLRMPCALIQIGGSVTDRDATGLVEQSINVIVVQTVSGEALGENVIMGGPKSGGATSSRGRGLLEIEDALKVALKQLGIVNGVRLMWISASDAAVAGSSVEGAPTSAYREHTFTGWCTTVED